MSILKTIYLQHLNGSSPNATLDANGNMTVTGTVAGASSNMFRNRIINGAMVIDQRNIGASLTPNNATNSYAVDRFSLSVSQNTKCTVQQNAGSVTPPTGFSKYYGFTSTSSYTVVSGDYFGLQQRIEGYNIADLSLGTSGAKSFTLSFWVYSSLTGSFGLNFQNGSQTRSFATTYTISSANAWQYVTVTIPGDTTGTWTSDSSTGLVVTWGLGIGSTYSISASSAWQTTSSPVGFGTSGVTSIVGTNGATFYLTGVQLEVGTKATPFEFRHHTTELQLCQRYCWVNGGVSGQQYAVHGMGYIYGSTGATITIFPPVEMRDVPSLSSSGNFRIYDGGSAFSATIPAALNSSNSTRRVFVMEPSASGMTQYRPCNLSSNNDATAKIILASELT